MSIQEKRKQKQRTSYTGIAELTLILLLKYHDEQLGRTIFEDA
jgi:hypothetical protein